MTEHIRFPSIEQYRNVVRRIQDRARYRGKDGDGNPIIDYTAVMPKIKFRGSEKLHGTSSAISFSSDGSFVCQSRENVITPVKDNAGFAAYAHGQDWSKLFQLMNFLMQLKDDEKILVFGEWAGGNIQRGVAISQLEKCFVVFRIAKVVGDERIWVSEELVKQWCNHVSAELKKFYCIYDFKTFEIEIDFEQPEIAQNQLVEMTIAVEQESPFAKAMGADMNKCSIGEGIVWSPADPEYMNDSGLWFKVKGELHSKASKVTTLKDVDLEKVTAIDAVVTKVCPEWRLEQMLVQTFDLLNGGQIENKKIGDYIKAVTADIAKEDLDIVNDSGFTLKELGGKISEVSKKYLFAYKV